MPDEMKFPYGLADFSQIRSEGYVYVDRTGYIPVLEEMGRHLFFVRPRRFGKSLTVSMLGYYYDAAYRDRFDQLFEGLAIHDDPTARQGTYLVLRLDFSGVYTSGDMLRLERSFVELVRSSCLEFLSRYGGELPRPARLEGQIEESEGAEEVLRNLLREVMSTGRKVYVLIDEYDNFANQLISARREEHYQQMVRNTGFVKTFYKVLKEYTQVGGGVVDRVFMTGVSPLMLDDLTSGFNITKNLSLEPELNAFMGFTEEEVRRLVEGVVEVGGLGFGVEQVLQDMRHYYDGYHFTRRGGQRLYNPDMALYFLDALSRQGQYPEEVVDQNLKTDYGKLELVARADRQAAPAAGTELGRLMRVLEEGEVEGRLVGRFGLESLGDPQNFDSLLYYLGLLTVHGMREGSVLLRIPNYVVRTLYWEYLEKLFSRGLDEEALQLASEVRSAVQDLAFRGKARGYFDLLVEKVLIPLSNRDFIRFDEKAVKVVAVAYLGLTPLYQVWSETEWGRGYADVVLMPDPRFGDQVKYAWVWELKYLKKSDDSPQARTARIEQGRAQLEKYLADPRPQAVLSRWKIKAAVVLLVAGQEAVYQEV